MQTDNIPLPDRLHRSTIYIMVQLMKVGYREANKLFGNQRLRLMHYAAAAYIEADGSLSQKELSRLLRMDASDLAKILDSLEKEGYLLRETDSRDRRRYSVSLTRAGRQWLEEREELADCFDQTFFAKLSEEEKEGLRGSLLKLMR